MFYESLVRDCIEPSSQFFKYQRPLEALSGSCLFFQVVVVDVAVVVIFTVCSSRVLVQYLNRHVLTVRSASIHVGYGKDNGFPFLRSVATKVTSLT